MRGTLEILETVDELTSLCVEKIATILNAAVDARGSASFVLAGGSTPRGVYERLGSEKYRERIRWECVHLFWGDERTVPPYMPESNFGMVRDALLNAIMIPEENVHRIEAELLPALAAHQYEVDLMRHFHLEGGELPRFDLVLLGMGEDGHTASLFPNAPVLSKPSGIVAEYFVEGIQAHRFTITLPAINNATNIIVLVTGKNKSRVLSRVFEKQSQEFPASLVDPVSGNLMWLVDRDAASKIQKGNVL